MSSITPARLGLSLSGGGYRASAFHLGTLKKLQSLNILHQVKIISTISGGSITGAYYALKKDDFESFSESLYEKLQTKNIIKQIFISPAFLQLIIFVLIFLGTAFYSLFTGQPWLFLGISTLFIILLLKFQFKIFPVSRQIEKIYDKFYYGSKTLKDLPADPLLVVGSTNLQTARTFTFSKSWMQDSTYQYMDPKITFEAADFPIARAVMASSCVPFAFTPVKIDRRFFTNKADADRVHPVLIDGGVYDNQGIHKIVQTGRYACNTIITSDAGSGNANESTFSNTIGLLLSTVNVFMSRIKNVQMVQDVYNNAATAEREIAYLSLGWDSENCISGFIRNLTSGQIPKAVIEAHQLKPEWVASPKEYTQVITEYLQERINYAAIDRPTAEEKKIARKVGTNLTALSKKQVDCLIKQAEALTEIQVKLYCPGLLK